MDTKKIIKELIPPLFLRLSLRGQKNNTQPTFKNYQDASNAAGTYEESDLIKVIVGKTVNYVNNGEFTESYNLDNLSNARSIRTLIAISSGISKDSLNILDFGGSAGIHYFTAKKMLKKTIKLRWIVAETNKLVDEVKKTELENDELSFVSSLDDLINKNIEFDIVYANYSLVYTSNPLFFLDKLLQLNTKKWFITNTALNLSENSIVGLQTSTLSTNGVGRDIPEHLNIKDRKIVYPFTLPSKKEFENKINEYGNIISAFKESSDTYITDVGNFHNYGYIVTKK